MIERICKDVYEISRLDMTTMISRVAEDDLGVEYGGIFGLFQYAEELKTAILFHISSSVESCEESARQRAVEGVNAIKQLGLSHLGNEFAYLNFRSDVMFRRKRDALAKQVDIKIEMWDFLDWSVILQRQEKVSGGMAMTVVTVAGTHMLGKFGSIESAL